MPAILAIFNRFYGDKILVQIMHSARYKLFLMNNI